MSQHYDRLAESHIAFIGQQKIFFVATAARSGRVNLSPKGMDSLRVLGENRVVWLNLTGSGNETAAHLLQEPRMTIMFCAFTGKPLILRLYGTATAVHRKDAAWPELSALFAPLPGARQVFDLRVEAVQTSCGFAVPFFEFAGEREQLKDWALAKGEAGIRDYWEAKNQTSIDGLPTHILEKST